MIWGSTYLGIKIAVDSMPPLMMSAARFTIAGTILYALARLRGADKPQRAHWVNSGVVGAFLIAGGNGAVCYAEVYIDSGMASLIIASNPLFMTLFGWLAGVQARPKARAWLSVFGGLVGVAVLIVSGGGIELGNTLTGYFVVLAAVLCWTGGSVYSKRKPQKLNPWLQSGMQMFCGGLVSLVASFALGEPRGFSLDAVTANSWLAFVYLVIVGSLLGFTSYVFLLRNCAPSTVSSHAYVNPVVAVLLGSMVLGESLSVGGWVGSALILVSVFFLLKQNKRLKRT